MSTNLKIFSETIDPKAIHQMYEAMKHPSVIRGALMPDAHLGYSLPIGGVALTDGWVSPAWVGYDIGCGMIACKTSFKRAQIREHRDAIFDMIYKKVPVGRNWHDHPLGMQDEMHTWVREVMPRSDFLTETIFHECAAGRQLGTLGGGNHFIEIGYDELDTVWVVVHCGSRNVGHRTATQYMRMASPTGKASEGNWGFDFDSENGKAYWDDMNWNLEFALENRKFIMIAVQAAIQEVFLNLGEGTGGEIHFQNMINRNHNHATLAPDGSGIIHRKGATHAELGMGGVIPGNMHDGGFIVEGLGNPEGLWSSSHGAGRVLGRREAKEVLKLKDFEAEMKGIKAKVGRSTLDESRGAYKDIFEVMDLQSELVDVVAYVKPIINIKG